MQSWMTVVSDLIARFSGDMSTVPVLLDVLIVLPEEVGVAVAVHVVTRYTLGITLEGGRGKYA